jgi:hypothetical protein
MDGDDMDDSYDKARSFVGETLENLITSEGWRVFKEKVLDVEYDDAFKSFKSADTTKPEQIIAAQQKALLIEGIESKVNSLITEGHLAQENLRRLSEGDEDE